MSSLYPSLEDMQVDKMLQVQAQQMHQQQQQQQSQQPPAYADLAVASASGAGGVVYPDLGDFMGLELSEQMLATNMPAFVRDSGTAVAIAAPSPQPGAAQSAALSLRAPLSGGLQVAHSRAQQSQAIRELVLCKGADGKVGLRVRAINNGCFVSIVVRDSPAATAGLRFGDQILQVNGQVVAGFSTDQLHALMRRAPVNGISVVVRDRPFERTLTLHKDSHGRLGMRLDGGGRVTDIVRDSSAARNGMLTDHQVLEVNGQHVVGMTEKERTRVLEQAGQVVAVTVVPTFIYEHMVKKLSSSFLRGIMDHSTDF